MLCRRPGKGKSTIEKEGLYIIYKYYIIRLKRFLSERMRHDLTSA